MVGCSRRRCLGGLLHCSCVTHGGPAQEAARLSEEGLHHRQRWQLSSSTCMRQMARVGKALGEGEVETAAGTQHSGRLRQAFLTLMFHPSAAAVTDCFAPAHGTSGSSRFQPAEKQVQKRRECAAGVAAAARRQRREPALGRQCSDGRDNRALESHLCRTGQRRGAAAWAATRLACFSACASLLVGRMC